MKTFLAMLVARFKEPSSWGGLATILLSLGISMPADLSQPIMYTGAGVAGLLAFFLKEKPAA